MTITNQDLAKAVDIAKKSVRIKGADAAKKSLGQAMTELGVTQEERDAAIAELQLEIDAVEAEEALAAVAAKLKDKASAIASVSKIREASEKKSIVDPKKLD